MIKRKLNLFFWQVILQLAFLGPALADQPASWNQVADKLQKRVALGNLGNDVSVTFQNAPYKKYMEDELMAYTLRSDGEVIIQMNAQIKMIKVLPDELLWLAKFLIEHKFEDFPEKETQLADSASFAINLKVGNARKGIWLYNKGNDKNREVVWQYMFHLGQLFLENAGLRDKSEAIFPVCNGINRVEELDSNNDGRIEWLRLKIGFYAFKSGEFTFNFSGVSHSVFLAQGKSEKDFFLNTYLLQPAADYSKEYLALAIDSQPASMLGPYRMDLGSDLEGYRNKNLRISPDFVFQGPGKNRFPLRLHQSVIVEVKNSRTESENKLLRFTLLEINSAGARLVGKDEPVFLALEENIPLGDFGCVSSVFGLVGPHPGGAIFEVGWDIPEEDTVQRQTEYFQGALLEDNYQGDKETARSSLDFSRKCLGQLDDLEDIQINVIYSTPAEAI
jgi:hypothetical protein